MDVDSINDESIRSTEENHDKPYKSIDNCDCDYPNDTLMLMPDDFLNGKPDDMDDKPIQKAGTQQPNLQPRPSRRNINRDLGFNRMTHHQHIRERIAKHKQNGSRKRRDHTKTKDPYGNKKQHKEMKAYINLIVGYNNPEDVTSFFIKHISLTQYRMKKGLRM